MSPLRTGHCSASSNATLRAGWHSGINGDATKLFSAPARDFCLLLFLHATVNPRVISKLLSNPNLLHVCISSRLELRSSKTNVMGCNFPQITQHILNISLNISAFLWQQRTKRSYNTNLCQKIWFCKDCFGFYMCYKKLKCTKIGVRKPVSGWHVWWVCWPCKNWDVFSFQGLWTDPCNMGGRALSCCNTRWWSWMNGTTMGLRILSRYLCAFKMLSIKCTCVCCP